MDFGWRVERKSSREGKEQGSMEGGGDDCVVVVGSGGVLACCRITEWTGYQCHTIQFLG